MGSWSFGEAERLKKCSSFEAVRFAKIRSGHISKGWASVAAGSELQHSRALLKRGKGKKREKDHRLTQSQRSNPGTSSASPAGNMYEPQLARTFSAEEARAAIRTVLEGRLKGAKYEPQGSALAAVELAEGVKKAVKALGYERYKIVCYLVLGEATASDLSCCSRAVWSPNVDTFAEFCFQNDSLFALCLVFAVYQE
ncbi:dynein light chain Tctex-type protein 2B [Scyliorhinus canicula]|uniref:dynein light chain Tctex-type protein 2B n=1 Tax=Scyliorhinus canicula TaxID=7830 RepID=UPI0018F2DF67|nr:dynein light chain Tctex-type protein 2B [Scyliorhinus canicula]